MLVLGIMPLLAARVDAQLITMEQYHGRQIGCMASGLHGAYTWCGSDKTLGYAYIFVGSILSISDVKPKETPGVSDDSQGHTSIAVADAAENREFRLSVHPEEMFAGQPAPELILETRQGDCLDNDHPFSLGDRWLFFVRREDRSGTLVFYWGSRSGPVDASASELALLRLEKQHPEAGLVTGTASIVRQHSDSSDWEPWKGHILLASRQSDGLNVSAESNSSGIFQFPPLPPGGYHLNPNTQSGWWGEEVDLDVKPGGCVQVPVELSRDGTISGRVLNAAGQPVENVDVWVDPSHGPLGTGSAFTSADGRYTVHGLPAGRYLVYIQPPNSEAKVFYPSASDEQRALPILLGDTEHRENIDFHLR